MLLRRLRSRWLKTAVNFLALLVLIYFILFQQINEKFTKFIKRKNLYVANINSLLRNDLDGLPWSFVEQHKLHQRRWNASCANYPNLLQLEFHNKYWQIYKNAEVYMRIYGAYFDKRPTLPHRPAIRLLAFINQPHEVRVKNYCQIWFDELEQPTIVEIASYKILWSKKWLIPWLHLVPYLITCILPENKKSFIPQAVSVVSHRCQNATNNFRVIYETLPLHSKRAKFAVCLKGLSFPYTDLSTVLIEWLEMMRLLGVDKVYMNILQVHANISKVISYYEQQNFVQSRFTTLAHFANGLPHSQQFALSNFQWNRRFHEMMQYNDCFYRNIYKYEFIAIMDIDEIIMPLKPYSSWLELVKISRHNLHDGFCTGNIDAYCFRHAHFPLKFPNGVGLAPLRFLKHLKRYKNYSAWTSYNKCWHNTTSVLAVHNHFPFYYIDQKFCVAFIKTNVAQLQHYRYAVKDYQNLGKLIIDDNILRFSEALTNRSFKAFEDLGFIPVEWLNKIKLNNITNKKIY